MSIIRSSARSCASVVLASLAWGMIPGEAVGENEPGMLARGGEIFSREWVAADSRSQSGDGLGPVFNETSCVGCHGMGAPGGGGPSNKNVVVLSANTGFAFGFGSGFGGPGSQRAGKQADEQDRRLAAIHPGFTKTRSLVLHRFGVSPEYRGWLRELGAALSENERSAAAQAARTRGGQAGRKSEGTSNSVADEIATLVHESAARDQTSVVSAPGSSITLTRTERNAPALFGAGLLDRVPDAALEEVAAAQDATIRGRVHKTPERRIGRFGWKAQTASLREFVLVACAGELGLEVPGHHQSASPLAPDAAPKGLDLSQTDCDALIAYVRTMPAPIQLRPTEKSTLLVYEDGEALFKTVGCAGCHVPDLGDVSGVYSDMLLHSMGEGLSDGGQYYGSSGSPGDAQPTEWRTPPLWGFRDSAPYLHDGRAQTLDEAVAHHGGQADESAKQYFELSVRSRSRIESFLKSLVAPTAAAIASVTYPSAAEARSAMKRRAETEQMLLEDSLLESRRAAAEKLADAKRIAEETRVAADSLARQVALQREEAEKVRLKSSIGRVESLLSSARDLERTGKVSAALDFYREIVRDFKRSEQGRVAAERIEALAPSH